MTDEDRYRTALERLALPLAFDVPRCCTIEEVIRMHYAQAIIDGATLEQAEGLAVERAE